MRQNLGPDAGSGVAQAQLPVFFAGAQGHYQLAVAELDLVERLQRVHQQVVQDLVQRDRLGPDLEGRTGQLHHRLDPASAKFRLQQM